MKIHKNKFEKWPYANDVTNLNQSMIASHVKDISVYPVMNISIHFLPKNPTLVECLMLIPQLKQKQKQKTKQISMIIIQKSMQKLI